MPLGRKSLEAKEDVSIPKKSPLKRFNLGRNIEDIQKFFHTLKLAKPKVDTRWPEGSPLRSKPKSPVVSETLQRPKSADSQSTTPKRPRSFTIGSAKDLKCKFNKEKKDRLSLPAQEDQTYEKFVPTTYKNTPEIVVNDENSNTKSQVDFSQLFNSLTEFLKSAATDDEKKKEVMTTCKSMQEKFSEMEKIVECLQTEALEVCEILKIDVPKTRQNEDY